MSGPQVYIEDPVEREIYQNSADWTDINARTRALRFKPEDIDRYFVVRNFVHAAQDNVIEGIFSLLSGKIPPGQHYTISKLGEDSDDNHSDTLDQRWCVCYEFKTDKELKRLYFTYPCRLFWKSRKEIVEWFKTEGKSQIDKAVAWLDDAFPNKNVHIEENKGKKQ